MDINIGYEETIKSEPSEHDYQSTKSYNLRKRSCLKRSYDPSMWVTDEFYATNNNATDFVSGTDPLSTGVPGEDLLDYNNVELQHETSEIGAEIIIDSMESLDEYPTPLQTPSRVLEETFESNSQFMQCIQPLGETQYTNTQFVHQLTAVDEETKETLFNNCEIPTRLPFQYIPQASAADENGGVEAMAKFVADLANLSKNAENIKLKKKKLDMATMLQELTMTPALISQFQQWNLIATNGSLHCEHGHTFILREATYCKDNFRWICYHRYRNNHKKYDVCSKRQSIRKNTFFEKSNLSLFQVVCFTYLWLENYSLKFIRKEIKIAGKTAVDWARFHREVVNAAMDPERQKIGGLNKIIEVDEFTFGSRKYRGQTIGRLSVFGGIERGSGKCFMVPVESTDKEVILCIIQKWISAGTTLISDCWKTYNCLKDKRYQYLGLNNSLIFQAPDKKADTKYIKEMLLHVNAFIPKQSKRKRYFKGYLSKFMFLNNSMVEKVEVLPQFFKYAAELTYTIQNMETSDDETYQDNA